MSKKAFAISPAVRISFGLAMFTVSVLLIADMLGFIPNQEKLTLEARQKVSESLAVQLSVAATTGNHNIIDAVLESFVERNNDVVAASMAQASGEMVSVYGQFSRDKGETVDTRKSKLNNVFVPIYSGSKRWGTVNIEFQTVATTGIFSLISETPYGMFVFIFISCLIGYTFMLRKALKVLDPKAVVPERVKAAFNTLSEGVLILDKKEQIMMANDAFSRQIGKDSDDLIGVKASSLKLKTKAESDDDQLPWKHTIDDGSNQVGVTLDMATPRQGIRSMSTNSAPITDEGGKTRGALVTFDDVTEVEEANVKLVGAVDQLEKNDVEMRQKNRELEILASRDSLTGCYNRRAFFELFENSFKEAEKTDTALSCIMLDVDHFKSINDRFGHTIGDEVLRMVSAYINACDYENAVVGRYGGEEFCLILPGADAPVAKKVADVIRMQIKEASEKYSDSKTLISASFGVSCCDATVKDHAELLEQADTALYTAKTTGRDQVVTWEEHLALQSEQGEINGDISSDDSTADGENNQNQYNTQLKLLNERIHELEDALDKKEAVLDKDKLFDSVTGLPTRYIFEDRIRQSIALSERTKDVIAVVILNIDLFSRINSTLGKDVGDKFLAAVGQRLMNIMRRSDTITAITSENKPEPSLSRLRDDEFALLLTGFDSAESLSSVIKRIQKEIAGKITIDNNDLYNTTTIGVAVSPDDGNTPSVLIERAQAAQKQAKEQRGKNNYVFYSQELHQRISSKMQMELDMHKAIDNDEFYIEYQPKLDISKGAIDSMEALIRWNHPEQGFIPPNDFIPQAEETGVIVKIGEWCLQTVCQQIRTWDDMGASDLRVSVNISAIEFSSDDFVERVSSILKETGIKATSLELEITETTIMSDTNKAKQIINELRFRDITVTLDDFGTGYSSLNYLGNMNFDWIKIDRSFMLEAMKHEKSKTLYSGIVKMAQDIGLSVVSEGIETQAEYNYVKDLGVDELQGYILHKSLDVETMTDVLFNGEAGTKIAV